VRLAVARAPGLVTGAVNREKKIREREHADRQREKAARRLERKRRKHDRIAAPKCSPNANSRP
jgi:hypothetical protein